MTHRGGGVSPSSKAVKLGDNYGDLPTPTRTGYTFAGWQTSDGTAVTSTTQNATIGDHTLSASWTAKTYSVTSGSNLTGVSVSVSSTGTFGSGLSISSSGSATGYNYSISNIKVYSGNNTSGTLLATINATSGTFTMSGTYYSSVYVYATWSRSTKTYTITLDRQGGSGGSSSATATYNATLPSISVPSRAGYTFGGYYTSTGGSGTQYYNSSGAGTRSWTTDGGSTLYAKWIEHSSYLTRNWTSRIGDDTSLNTVTTSIIFTKDSSKITGLSNSVSVGTNSQTSTSAYTATTGVDDVRAYWGSDKSTIVIYSPCTIYAPQDCSKLFTISLNGSSTTSSRLSKLINLDLTNFNTSNVTDMVSMFWYCTSLTSITFGTNFNTSKVPNMKYMFYKCTSLTSLDLSNFDTSNVEDMQSMFSDCSSLTSLTFGTSFNTSNVTTMYFMFYKCSSLTSLNLGNFNLASCTNFTKMLNRCSALTSITLPYNLQSGKTISLPASTYYKGSAGPYSTIGTATSGTTVACSTASSKVTLTKH